MNFASTIQVASSNMLFEGMAVDIYEGAILPQKKRRGSKFIGTVKRKPIRYAPYPGECSKKNPNFDSAKILKLVRDLYNEKTKCSTETGRCGGHLHIVLDDGNLKDSDVRFCIKNAIADRCKVCAHISMLMLLLTQTQRNFVYSNKHNWRRHYRTVRLSGPYTISAIDYDTKTVTFER